MPEITQYLELIKTQVFEFSPKIIYAILSLVVGLWLIRWPKMLLRRALNKSKVDGSLQGFMVSLVGMLLKLIVYIGVISMLGVQTSSFVAIMGAAGLAVGLALQGSLANFAGGVLILFFKPFRTGDFIEAQGFSGTVNDIQVFNTILKTPDNKVIIIPNGPLSNGCVMNYSMEKTRRIDLTYGIGYGDDIKKAKEVLKRIIDYDKRILTDPEPLVAVSELGDSSVNIVVRVWTEKENYWKVYFDMQENVKLIFDKAGISFPFPQQDVHIISQNPPTT